MILQKGTRLIIVTEAHILRIKGEVLMYWRQLTESFMKKNTNTKTL